MEGTQSKVTVLVLTLHFIYHISPSHRDLAYQKFWCSVVVVSVLVPIYLTDIIAINTKLLIKKLPDVRVCANIISLETT